MIKTIIFDIGGVLKRFEYVKYINSLFDNPDTVLAGIEARTSSPVRIIRNEEFISNIDGVYPCGEGAGYAGGITSAAIDGIKVAEQIGLLLNNK